MDALAPQPAAVLWFDYPCGQPRPELFIKDLLHFNAEGYKLLAERVRADVERAYPAK